MTVCVQLHRAAIHSISRIRNLQSLDLSYSAPNRRLGYQPHRTLSSACVINLALGLPLLTELHISDCRGVDASSIPHLVHSCPLLRDLSLRNCPCVDGVALKSLARCKNLQVTLYGWCCALIAVCLDVCCSD